MKFHWAVGKKIAGIRRFYARKENISEKLIILPFNDEKIFPYRARERCR